MATEEILSPTTFITEWTSIDYCKTSDFFFWLIFLVSSPPSLTTVRLPHSSSVNTSLDESSKFPMSSISIQYSSFSTITFFLKGCFFQWNRDFFENKTWKVKQVSINKRSLLDFISYIFVFFWLYRKNCNKSKSSKMIG